MKKTMLFVGAAALALVLGLSNIAAAKCADCEKGMKGKSHCSCPCKIKGAETVVANTEAGVTITITAKDPETVKKIQESAAKMKDGGCDKGCQKGCKCAKCAKKGGCDCGCEKCKKEGCKSGCDCGCEKCKGKKKEEHKH